ncbi:MAG: ketopantoate reductase family protein [Chloroflexi bacterium]|nr:ketopantoate reductase family protein [Chloroflexota bacterium]
MKVVILGAGALGSVYGGHLARAGFDVTLIGRDPHIRAVRTKGLRVSGAREFVVHPTATTDARTVKEADLLLVCVRAIDTEQALSDVAHLRPDMVVSFQNGIYKDDALIARFGPGPVMGASSIVATHMVEPGHVRCALLAHTWFGELDNHRTPRLQGLISMWRRAEMPADIPDSIQVCEWSKLAYLLPVSALSALTRLPYHLMLQSPDLAYLFVQMVREAYKIARAYNLRLSDYPGIPVRTLAENLFEQSVRWLIARGKALESSGQTDITANMLHDVVMKRRTEIESIAGDLIKLAQDAGLSIPSIHFAYRAIRGIDHWASR